MRVCSISITFVWFIEQFFVLKEGRYEKEGFMAVDGSCVLFFGARLNRFLANFRHVDEDFFDDLEDFCISSSTRAMTSSVSGR